MPAGKNIKHAMIERGIKQKELAGKLGVTTASLSKMLSNDKIGYNGKRKSNKEKRNVHRKEKKKIYGRPKSNQ